MFGNNVDYTINRISSPQGGSWAADNLDSFDILQHGVLHVPVDPGEEGGVNAAAIHEY